MKRFLALLLLCSPVNAGEIVVAEGFQLYQEQPGWVEPLVIPQQQIFLSRLEIEIDLTAFRRFTFLSNPHGSGVLREVQDFVGVATPGPCADNMGQPISGNCDILTVNSTRLLEDVMFAGPVTILDLTLGAPFLRVQITDPDVLLRLTGVGVELFQVIGAATGIHFTGNGSYSASFEVDQTAGIRWRLYTNNNSPLQYTPPNVEIIYPGYQDVRHLVWAGERVL